MNMINGYLHMHRWSGVYPGVYGMRGMYNYEDHHVNLSGDFMHRYIMQNIPVCSKRCSYRHLRFKCFLFLLLLF